MAGNPLPRIMEATLGNMPASWLLLRVAFWWPRAKVLRDGKVWIAKSRQEWMAETGLSLEQYKDGLSRLRKSGLVETRQGHWGNKNVTFLTLTEQGERVLKAPPEWSPQAPLHIQGDTNKKIPLEEYSGVIPSDHASTNPSCPDKEVSGEMKQKPTSAKDVLTLPSMKKLHKPDKVEGLIGTWRDAVNEVYGLYTPPMTMKQQGQLGHFLKSSPSGKAGFILDAVLRDWVGFVKTVQSETGNNTLPPKPSVDFLLKHSSIAINFGLEKAKAPVHKAAPSSPATNQPPVKLTAQEDPDDKIATLEDVLAPPEAL